MITETRAMSATAAVGLACPRCRGELDDDSHLTIRCRDCGGDFPIVARIPDLRIHSDRYLDLESDRAKAIRLQEQAESLDLAALISFYYDISPDVGSRREAFEARLARSAARARALSRTLPTNARILELGCGSGALIAACAGSRRQIVGADVAMRWLAIARKRLNGSRAGENAPLVGACAESLPWRDGTFDAVVADSVLEHVEAPARMFAECLRVIRPGGRLILWSPNRLHPGRDPHVGLFGVGLLPRRLGRAYAAMRVGAWLPHLHTAKEAARIVGKAGFVKIETGPPRIDPVSAPDYLGERGAELYHFVMRHAIVRRLATSFGPLWSLSAEKPS